MRDTVVLFDTLVYGIDLPELVVNAINRKTEQYYISEEYKFRIERERRESERKRIEAEGIHEFQQIVSQGISDSYLAWRGIEATLQLAQSTNSKVVIIGNAKDGLPLILGGTGASAPQKAGGPSGGDTVADGAKPASDAAAASKNPPAARSDAPSAAALQR
jgi:regulator of protease activity HflC (stomatin/prohibitin superfamily)